VNKIAGYVHKGEWTKEILVTDDDGLKVDSRLQVSFKNGVDMKEVVEALDRFKSDFLATLKAKLEAK